MCIWRGDIFICNISAVISCLEKACCRQALRGVIYVLAERYCSRLWINCQTVFSQQIMPFSSKLLWNTLLLYAITLLAWATKNSRNCFTVFSVFLRICLVVVVVSN